MLPMTSRSWARSKECFCKPACQRICLQHRDIPQVTPGNLILRHVRKARRTLESNNGSV